MNIFEEKTDSELLSYFSDYQSCVPLTNILDFKIQTLRLFLNPIGRSSALLVKGVLGHDFFEAVFHRWEKTVHND